MARIKTDAGEFLTTDSGDHLSLNPSEPGGEVLVGDVLSGIVKLSMSLTMGIAMTTRTSSLGGASRLVAITPNDATVYQRCRALYVGTGGDVAVTDPDGVTTTLKNVPSGQVLPIEIVKVMNTNTTASDLVLWY